MHTQEELKTLIRYDSETGALYRLNKDGTERPTGNKNSTGYIQLMIDGIFYYAHRLIWILVYNESPDYIDHINRNTGDNRLCNLRSASMSQNIANSKVRIDSVSGIKGVYWHKQRKRWYARIKIGKSFKSLGSHDTKEQAAEIFRKAAIELHGEFARFG
jgi:hypothetical protein